MQIVLACLGLNRYHNYLTENVYNKRYGLEMFTGI